MNYFSTDLLVGFEAAVDNQNERNGPDLGLVGELQVLELQGHRRGCKTLDKAHEQRIRTERKKNKKK